MLLAVLCAALTVFTACTEIELPGQTAAPAAPAVPSITPSMDMTARLLANQRPVADLFDLTRRLRGRDGLPARPFQPAPAPKANELVGTVGQFWIYDFDAKRNVRVQATLRFLTEHTKWWVADGVNADVTALSSTAATFDTKTYPTNRRLYGSEWTPGIDGDQRLSIIVARIPGRAAGYFSSADQLPAWINELSAERELIYVNSLAARFGSDELSSVLAHEHCHMIQFNKPAPSINWFAEGHAQLCERANGHPVSFAQTFLNVPDTQLNAWPADDPGTTAAYGVAFLFLEFLREHAGGEALINALLERGVQGPSDIDAVLRARGQPSVDELFADFAAANALIGSSPEARYAYTAVPGLRAATAALSDRLAMGATARTTVHNYATRYIELPRGAFHLSFSGAPAARVIPTAPHSGAALWWSDRADSMDSTLTRAVDLRAVRGAALTFWTWYDIEPDFDYLYVATSTDGGKHWTTLKAPATTTENPNGGSLGDGFTGISGGGKSPAWVQQRVDLSAYDGREILLRFEYVTDQGLSLDGAAIDDIEITQVLKDDAETDGGWQASGFIRSTNVVTQPWLVQVIRFGATTSVARYRPEGGVLELDLDTTGDRRPPLLAVSGLASRSTEAVAFTVSTRAR